MNAGDLKYRIMIYKPVRLTSDYGNEKIEYELKTTCRCSVKHDPSSKSEDQNEVVYKEYKTIQVYNFVDILEEDRIFWNKKFYFIISLDEEPERNRKTIVISQIKN